MLADTDLDLISRCVDHDFLSIDRHGCVGLIDLQDQRSRFGLDRDERGCYGQDRRRQPVRSRPSCHVSSRRRPVAGKQNTPAARPGLRRPSGSGGGDPFRGVSSPCPKAVWARRDRPAAAWAVSARAPRSAWPRRLNWKIPCGSYTSHRNHLHYLWRGNPLEGAGEFPINFCNNVLRFLMPAKRVSSSRRAKWVRH